MALPYFVPVYPAVIRQCQLCGAQTAIDEYLTQACRDMENRARGGEIVLCLSCGEFADEVQTILSEAATRMDLRHADERDEALRQLATQLVQERGPKPAGGRAKNPSRSRVEAQAPSPSTRRKRVPGTSDAQNRARIPNPTAEPKA